MKALLKALKDRGIQANEAQVRDISRRLGVPPLVTEVEAIANALTSNALPPSASDALQAKVSDFEQRVQNGFVESLGQRNTTTAKSIAQELVEVQRALPDQVRAEFARLVAEEALTEDSFRL